MHQLTAIGNTITMTSLDLVDFINSQRGADEAELTHANFLAKVPKVLGDGGVIQFQDTYTHPQNGQTYPCFRFPKREACLMAMSYSYDLQAKVFDRMTALEAQAEAMARFNLPKTYSEAMRLAADQADQIEAQQAQLAIAAPKAEALDRIAGATGSITIREAAKDLQVKPLTFSNWLREHKWIYKQGRSNLAHQPRIDAGYMAHKVTLVEVEGDDGVTFEKPVTQARITPKGLAKLAVVFGEVTA